MIEDYFSMEWVSFVEQLAKAGFYTPQRTGINASTNRRR
jgi:hypothetical protein